MTNNNEVPEWSWKGRLDGIQRSHLLRLLNMYYSPKELSEIMGFSNRQVYRVYIPFGCPVFRDPHGYLWINGKQFREWYLKTYQSQGLAPDEAFCLTCKRAVKIQNPERKTKGRLVYVICTCGFCGRRLARILSQQRQTT